MSHADPKRRVAFLLLIVLALAGLSFGGASQSGTVHAAGSPQTVNTGDCNHNGVSDSLEGAWAARDDDGDGVCNGSDVCPLEANADQNPAACAMQAITVPADPADLSLPHVMYSGASITLKGMARYGGSEYMWDFGDGSPPTAWIAISNPYDLGIPHAYTGAVGQR